MAALGGIAILCWGNELRRALGHRLYFDDAYMFYRYAWNMRHGYGMSWNAGLGHTYGPTSLLWTFCVFVMSFIPAAPSTVLVTGSWLAGAAAIVAMGWAVAGEAHSNWLRSPWRASVLIALPLLLSFAFTNNSVFGMDTMLSTGLNAIACAAVLRWARAGTRGSAMAAGAAGFVAYLARPDSVLPFVLMTGLAALLLCVEQSRRTLPVLFGVLAGLLAIQLVVCRVYFGTFLPLSVHVKTGNTYDGYAENWQPLQSMLAYLGELSLFVVPMLVFAAGRRVMRIAVTLLIPAVTAAAYFTLAVVQIMGRPSRYYVPLTPFVVIPGMLALDTLLARGGQIHIRGVMWRVAGVYLLFLLVMEQGFLEGAFEKVRGRVLTYPPPVATIAAIKALPTFGSLAMQFALANQVLTGLPAGTSIAATEVGYMGVAAPQVNIIDLSGLNDADVALRGFNPDRLLARQPDLIWMPLPEYTGMYGRLYSDPALLSGYTVWAGMFDSGLAVRKSGPHRQAIEENIARAWSKLYPGYRMQDYVVSQITWDAHKRRAKWSGLEYHFEPAGAAP